MRLYPALSVPLVAITVIAQGTVAPWGQCGGIGYSGPSACGAGYGCTSYNPYYFQCVPGGPTSTSSSTTSRPTSKTATTTTTSPPPTTTPPTTTTSIPGGGSLPTTLQSGWYWIRAVESPNFHSYLQSKPTGTPGYAYLDTNTGAGQFNIKDGQLVYNRGANEDPLYMNVEDPADKTQRKLQTWFNQTKNAYGTFAFQGDTVTWTVADINRPNTAAWLVCEDQELYINTGAYLYQTPPGCVDETIHSYGGSTPDV